MSMKKIYRQIGGFLLLTLLASILVFAGPAKKQAQASTSFTSYYAYVKTPTLILYKKRSSNSTSKKILYMTKIKVCDKVSSCSEGDWYKVRYNSKYYYVWKAASKSIPFTKTKSSFSYTTTNKYQKAVVNRALYILKNWKTTYAHKVNVIDSKGRHQFDCVGFATYVLNTAMQKYCPAYKLPWKLKTLPKMSNVLNKGLNGELDTKVVCKGTLDYSKLQPGDLLFFDEKKSGAITHVGIYLGNKEFIHITQSWEGVCIMPCTGIYAQRFVKAVRYIPSEGFTKVNKKCTTSTTQRVKVYKKMNISSSNVVTTLSRGSKVTVLYVNTNILSGFAYVRYGNGKYGFIYKPYSRLNLG